MNIKAIADTIRKIARLYSDDDEYDISYKVSDQLFALANELDSQSDKIPGIEKPLRRMIATAKETGKNIRTFYQDLVFTPDELEQYLANGKFRWWNISNWEFTDRPSPSQEKSDTGMFSEKPSEKSDYRVGDWVEYCGKQYQIKRIAEVWPSWSYQIVLTDNKCCNKEDITRKLDPREVEVEIKLKGTVSEPYFEPNKNFHFHSYYGDRFIAYEDVDPTTAETIRKLIKAQEKK